MIQSQGYWQHGMDLDARWHSRLISQPFSGIFLLSASASQIDQSSVLDWNVDSGRGAAATEPLSVLFCFGCHSNCTGSGNRIQPSDRLSPLINDRFTHTDTLLEPRAMSA